MKSKPLLNLDSFLCDLNIFKDFIEKGIHNFCCGVRDEWTDTVEDQGYLPAGDIIYRIEVIRGSTIIITKVQND